MSERITITKVDVVEGAKGPYPEVTIAGERFPKKVFSRDAQATLDGPGVYECWWEEKPNPKNSKYPYRNIVSLKKVGDANGPVQSVASTTSASVGDRGKDIRFEVAKKISGDVVAHAVGSKQIPPNAVTENVVMLTRKIFTECEKLREELVG